MVDEELAYDENTKQLYLDLFTEIAIIEHLVRERYKPYVLAELTPAEFGMLNHFVRLAKNEETLAMLAWSFQVELVAARATVTALGKRKLLELDWVDGVERVYITETGKVRHQAAIAGMAPDITEIMAEFDPEKLRLTTDTLKEIRRTFDNLPDR
jgi:hypothetical protein